MTENHTPYAPPKSTAANSVATDDAYFTVGTLKLSLMALTTFGFYELYWFYRNWKTIRERDHLPISPFWRAFFAPLWTFSLGTRFAEHAKERNITIRLPVAAVGVLYLVLTALWRLPEPYWMISFLSFIAMVPPNNAFERLVKPGTPAQRPAAHRER